MTNIIKQFDSQRKLWTTWLYAQSARGFRWFRLKIHTDTYIACSGISLSKLYLHNHQLINPFSNPVSPSQLYDPRELIQTSEGRHAWVSVLHSLISGQKEIKIPLTVEGYFMTINLMSQWFGALTLDWCVSQCHRCFSDICESNEIMYALTRHKILFSFYKNTRCSSKNLKKNHILANNIVTILSRG